ncbi:Pentulose kinase [Rhizopogon vinicolor AM-OR11-026]|uniref:Pentulose kinase n=1 Tax=Rhizopogon vinicolor AM-OR11-026 TaxID=1314800 RepID=A0A1B7N360_9AGAM|nr:Pentulose kinase [Rhizopogon vinicolor AM-OR11-026]
MNNDNYFIGIDIGTGSARASLVAQNGEIKASSTKDTITWRDQHDHRIFEQSTNNIWEQICTAVKEVLKQSNIPTTAVRGLGFDATCSLAVSDFEGNPVIVTKGGDIGKNGDRNIILWADHRAEKEAELINSTGSIVLNYVGGTMSLEMEVPKILWLKKRMDPALFARCQFFDLPDFFTYKATGDNTRSFCSTTCKCSYVPDKGWQPDFFECIGLGELVDGGNWKQIGAARGQLHTAGSPVGRGLSKKAAEELGLIEGTAVGSGLIDGYAGWMGTVAARYIEDGQVSNVLPSLDESRHRVAVVAGTSTCHIVQASYLAQSVPYTDENVICRVGKDAAFPGWWMNEGGQSFTGQLIHFILTTHHSYPELEERAKQEGKAIHLVLLDILERLRHEDHVDTYTELTKDIHFYPDFHGNRSPVADSRMRGSIVGLELDSSIADLARKYYLTLEAIALQTRHIVDDLNAAGHVITSLYMSGGQAKNVIMMQLFADTCGIPIVLPKSHSEAVVLGAAMLGRIAAEGVTDGEDMWKIMVEMTPPGTLVAPAASPRVKRLLDAKYKIFRETIDIQKRWRQQIEEAIL